VASGSVCRCVLRSCGLVASVPVLVSAGLYRVRLPAGLLGLLEFCRCGGLG